MPSNHLILWYPPFLLPSIFPSTRVFSMESVLHIRWPKYWSFSFSISLSNEYSGLISVRIDWFDLLAVQETLRSLLTSQFKSINSLALSFLYGPTFTSTYDYWKKLSHPYMTTGHTLGGHNSTHFKAHITFFLFLLVKLTLGNLLRVYI